MVGPSAQPRIARPGRLMSTPKSTVPAQLSSSPPEAWHSLLRLANLAGRPFERFLRIEAASGIVLLVSAAIALFWVNSAWAESYTQLWHTRVGIRLGAWSFERSLEWVVNDGLMVLFFFVVGMEIRREIHQGELSQWRRAALPVAAAFGGMIVPATLYLVLAGGPAARSGWGVPMATDIAFALGILTLMGKRLPAALRVLLLALAVIDDLGAIVVIALFYSSGTAYAGLFVAALGLVGILAMQRFGIRSKWAYVLPALVVWAGVYAAGIHPTIAGVIVGILTPVRVWLGPEGFVASVRGSLQELEHVDPSALSTHHLAATMRQVDVARREALSPAESLIENLHPWVAFGIMPVFALANAGVAISRGATDAASWSVMAAVIVGLVVGKPLGVLLACWISLRLRISTLPVGVTLKHLILLGVVAGVGFTMALFISQLAFTDTSLLAAAKLGVMIASGSAAVAALVLGRFLFSPVTNEAAAQSAAEAER